LNFDLADSFDRYLPTIFGSEDDGDMRMLPSCSP
jgi:hypothetical protein